MAILTTEFLTTLAWIGGIFGVGLVYRGTIASVVKATLTITIKNHMEQQDNLTVEYAKTRVMVRSEIERDYDLVPKDKTLLTTPTSSNLPQTNASINTMNHQLDGVQSDLIMLTTIINKEREDILDMIEKTQCPPELKDKCVEYFLGIRNLFSGNQEEIAAEQIDQ